MVELLEKFLVFSLRLHLVVPLQSLAEEWLFFVFLMKKEVFVADVNSGLHKK